ncbi:MAG: hypothetical protein DI629_03755 [Mesorhizobium amorphae]|nr:MAG: hypothetical protein DI629_03755 [Mesorhizobium amorphae]
MPQFMISYSLSLHQPYLLRAFKEHAQRHGLSPWVRGVDQSFYRLPDANLIGEFASMQDAQTAFHAARREAARENNASLPMPKWVIAEIVTGEFESDDRRTEEEIEALKDESPPAEMANGLRSVVSAPAVAGK